MALRLIENFDYLETGSQIEGDRASKRGGVLAFLPGLMEIDTMYKMCTDLTERKAR